MKYERFKLSECAELLGYSQDVLRVYCQRYKIGKKIKNAWTLTISEMQQIQIRKGKQGKK